MPGEEALSCQANLEFLPRVVMLHIRKKVLACVFRLGRGRRSGRVVEGHAKVGADDVDDGLAVLLVVLGKTFQGIKPAEPDGGLVVAELFDGFAVQIGDSAFGGVMGVVPCDLFDMGLHAFGTFAGYLFDALATVGRDQSHQGADTGDKSEDEFEQIQLSTDIQGLGFGLGRRAQHP